MPRQDELVRLDPRRPLYEPTDIAALKAKYSERALSRKKRSVGALWRPPPLLRKGLYMDSCGTAHGTR